jgi:hypothetical protein
METCIGDVLESYYDMDAVVYMPSINEIASGSISSLIMWTAMFLYLSIARCIIDSKPTKFSADSCTMLANFGEMVVRELEKEKILEAQKHEALALSQVKDSALRAINMIRLA